MLSPFPARGFSESAGPLGCTLAALTGTVAGGQQSKGDKHCSLTLQVNRNFLVP